MKTRILIIMMLAVCSFGWGQEEVRKEKVNVTEKEVGITNSMFSIYFEKDTIEVQRSNQDSIIIPIIIKTRFQNKNDWEGYILKIKDIVPKSSLAGADYSVNFEAIEFKNLKDQITVFVTLKKEILDDSDRSRILILGIETQKGDNDVNIQNLATIKEIAIVVKSSHRPLKDYQYLSYIGTNFDLVEGIKAQNFFFATNVFSRPTVNNKDFGIYLSLFGNRTVSLTENLGIEQIMTEIIPISVDSSYRVRKHVETIRTTHSDNLGAHISTLHPIFGSRNKVNGVKTYFTGSADFIWQRKHVLTEYGEVSQIDTLNTASTGHSIILNDLQNKSVSVNQYIFNIGPGLFFNIEDSMVSVRVHMSVGYTSTFFNTSKKEDEFLYDRKHDIYFAGRAWITEPMTGITLQAEIMNRLIEPKPMYVVTLSKAFNLDKLAGIFAPVTSR